MPRIPTIEAQNLDLRPTEVGVEARAAAARRINVGFNQLGAETERVGQRIGSEIGAGIRDVGQVAVDKITQAQVSHGSATFATLSDDLTNKWNDVVKNADPNDTSVAQKFREKVLEPALQNWTQNFNTDVGQKWAESHIAHLRQHMFEKTASDMVSLAKQAASDNLHQTVNQFTNTVYNDPSSLKFALDSFESSTAGIIASSPNLKGADVARVKMELSEKGREQIVKAAAIGYINKTGDVPKWVSDPAYSKYVNGVELEQFRKAAEAQKKANLYYDRQAAALKKHEADLQLHQDTNKFLSDTIRVDPNDPNKYLVDPAAKQRALDLLRKNSEAPSAGSTFRTLDAFIDKLEKPEQAKTDQTVKADLWSRLGAPDNPTNKLQVLDWAGREKLSTHDTSLLLQAVETIGPQAMHEPLVHAALQGASERAGVGLMFDGHERYSNFLQAFWPEYLRQKNNGTLKPNWADFKDETSLIRQTLKAYEPSRDERLRAAVMKNLQSVGGGTFTPPADWQFNAAKQQYRDPVGNLYDINGKPVK